MIYASFGSSVLAGWLVYSALSLFLPAWAALIAGFWIGCTVGLGWIFGAEFLAQRAADRRQAAEWLEQGRPERRETPRPVRTAPQAREAMPEAERIAA